MYKIIFAVLIFTLPLFSGCASPDELYVQAFAAFERGEYRSAIELMREIPEHNDRQNIVGQSVQRLLQEEVAFALQNSGYSNVITLLEHMEDFPDAQMMRRAAEYGLFRAEIIRAVRDAFEFGSYEYVLEILDENPDFDDTETNFRAQAIETSIAKAAEQSDDHMETLSVMIGEMFQIASLVIESTSRTTEEIEITREGIQRLNFLDPAGILTLVFDFDYRIILGLYEPENILINVYDNRVHIQSDTVQVSVLDSIIDRYELYEFSASTRRLRQDENAYLQLLEIQNELRERVAVELVTDAVIESARRNFKNILQGFMRGLGFYEIIWE